ncbi:MAG: tRNA (pseudouridine(54)-N(1))-methyltransferase TrmY [Candidatus Methanomethylophilaceae archaeon]|nr:tRNA (pseudouridine-N1)-methyltransferase [Methanomassiliicoccales archaeon RumEn M2]MDD2531988.1 tRNA (pseudouridine(54)-N(1))-methyltransferase TrmY [Candidatus Methanomethylophilaceae archaeon]MDI9378715.1 tRNA (pseudouridine(54)-N(1))-methyltransferase TrmY [Candidatus Thermoplasmatota archaeon]MDD2778610.1 tRNA (pseudouridine(54)-N(1))-methyltransferase TrmY [Candidatus Methanomethylophilaceae archaeon]MDD3128041.1 tRNA (pseudouridine(54)-N(1))-methyltransferase TrmY [Candidatus Methano
MIRFVIIGHRAHTTADFKLDDIAGGAGRLDVLVRCVNSAFFLSHNIRKDVELYLVLLGGEDAPKTLRFSGRELRYLNPDERSTASLIRNALLKKVGDTEIRASPGIYVSRMSFAMLMEDLSKTSGFVYLRENGEDVRGFGFPENPCFILGDDKDLTEEEEAIMSSYDFDIVNLGPQSLHANHCMILVLNEMDRRA